MNNGIEKARESMEKIEDLKEDLNNKLDTFSELLKDKFTKTGNDFDSELYYQAIVLAERVSPGSIGRCLRYESTCPGNKTYFTCHLDFNTWVNMRTEQDAPYYGMWCNPQLLSILEFADSEVNMWVFADLDDFKDTIKNFLSSDFRRMEIDLGDNPCHFNKLFVSSLEN